MQIARLIKSNVGLEVAFAEMRGWDTHFNEVGARPAQGQLANLLGQFGSALAAFYQDLGDKMADVSVVTMSEFGRTARENGSRGTDHGHANVMFALGGGIRGGKVYGDWPGLEQEQLYEQRDLQLTTDFRDVLGELVVRHLGNARRVERVSGLRAAQVSRDRRGSELAPGHAFENAFGHAVDHLILQRAELAAVPAFPAFEDAIGHGVDHAVANLVQHPVPQKSSGFGDKVLLKLTIQLVRSFFARGSIQARLEPLKQGGGLVGRFGQLGLGFRLAGHVTPGIIIPFGVCYRL